MKRRAAKIAIIVSAVVAVAGLPASAAAQFTTFVAPPRKAAVDSAKQAIVAEQTRTDSVTRMTITDMKAWVDSAAGVSANAQVATADTSAMAPQQPVTANQPPRGVTSFSEGAVAPATASPLPAFLAGGTLLLVLGLGLLYARPKAATRRSS